eukprot:TRINITY_DN7572_c0_g1_i9.p3 TRINITY_DN7572_c0_g1~~TRINITY_DN7572_c0_g1_i9.p3  ORF type:complete len:184 (-),score=63.84 TRINITY_DN7572_c0_g1_i9:174-725(-)
MQLALLLCIGANLIVGAVRVDDESEDGIRADVAITGTPVAAAHGHVAGSVKHFVSAAGHRQVEEAVKVQQWQTSAAKKSHGRARDEAKKDADNEADDYDEEADEEGEKGKGKGREKATASDDYEEGEEDPAAPEKKDETANEKGGKGRNGKETEEEEENDEEANEKGGKGRGRRNSQREGRKR